MKTRIRELKSRIDEVFIFGDERRAKS